MRKLINERSSTRDPLSRPVLFLLFLSAQLKASVIVSQEYPTAPPFFSVEVSCGKTIIRDSLTKVLGQM